MTTPLDKARMPVVILCGGQGTRLREETESRPKPMVAIGGQPILWHIMKHYGHHGFRRFVLCLGYRGWVIKEYFLRLRENLRDFTVSLASGEVEYHNRLGDEPWEVTCVETGEEAGTGARLRRVKRYVDTPTFLFTYGDAVSTVDLDALLAFHRREGRAGTVTAVRPASRYGELTVEGGGVVEFAEKPTAGEGMVSGGFFVFEQAIFDYLDEDPELLLERRPLQKLARDGGLASYLHEGFWHSMDTYRDYLHLNQMWKSGAPPWRIWGEE
jgi:glucose-1-phosphate cytidylyltransferase